MLISEERVKTSLQRSEHRLGMARYRRRRQKQQMIVGAIIVAALGVMLLLLPRAPQAPTLFVIWPNARKFGTAQVPDGSTVLIRKGQPFSVSVSNAQSWSVRSESDEQASSSATTQAVSWSPQQNRATLKLHCRPQTVGLTRLISWTWPERLLTLHGVAPQILSDGRVQLTAPALAEGAVRVSASVQAMEAVAWDERAIPLLQSARASSSGTSEAPQWTLTNSFDGLAKTGASNDEATYAIFNRTSNSPAQLMAGVARQVSRRAPDASLKLIVRPVSNSQSGVLRLAFDGSGARAGWIKTSAKAAGTPFAWWQDVAAPPASVDANAASIPPIADGSP